MLAEKSQAASCRQNKRCDTISRRECTLAIIGSQMLALSLLYALALSSLFWGKRAPAPVRDAQEENGALMAKAVRQVYIIDDDEEIRASLRFLLEDEAYRVEEAPNGVAALAFLEQEDEPWVVLLDRIMPRLDGLALLQAIAERPQMAARTAIIFLTARQETFTGATARLVAAQTFAQIPKPFDLEPLLVTIQQACQHLAERDSGEG